MNLEDEDAIMRPQDWLDSMHLTKESVGERSLRGGAIVTAAQVVKGGVDLASTLALARLVTPQDFGLVGMVASVTGLIGLFGDLGLSMATIQRDKITHQQVSKLFWINVALSAILCAITAVLAPAIAWFYGEPALIQITFGLAVAFLFGGLCVQHSALLKRNMFFGRIAIVELVSLIVGVSLAISLGWMDLGYWALVAKVVAVPAVAAVGYWSACNWRPARPRRGGEVDEMVTFGKNLTGFSLINYFARNLDDMLIGRLFGKRTLGLYQEAYKILMMPLRQINAPISTIAVPALSRLADDPDAYRTSYKRLAEKVVLITMPIGAVLLGAGDWVIAVVLGPQWAEAGPYVSWLAILVFSQPISSTTGWLFISQDRTDDMLRWGFLGSALAIASFVIGLFWGALGVAIAYSVSGFLVRMPLLIWIVGKKGPVSSRDIYSASLPAGLAGLIACAAVLGARALASIESAWAGAGMSVGVALCAYVLVLCAMPQGREALADVRSLVHEIRRGKS